MSAAFDKSRVLFRIIAGALVPPEGCTDAGDAVRELILVKPTVAHNDQPCIAIPQVDGFVLCLPEPDGHLYIDGESDERTVLEIFWALNEQDEPVLIVQDYNSSNFEWVSLTEDDDWKTLPNRGQIVKRFANAQEATRRYPALIVIDLIREKRRWKTYDVHSASGPLADDVRCATNRAIRRALGIEHCTVQIPFEHIADQRPAHGSPITVREVLPAMPNIKELEWETVVFIAFTAKGTLYVLIREDGKVEKRAFLRFHLRSFPFAQAKKIIAKMPQ